MSDARNTNFRLLDQLVDFVVMGVSFFISCLLWSVELQGGLFFQIVAYSAVLLVFVRLSKRTIVSYSKPVSIITLQILGNATGIVVGTCVVLLLVKLLATSGEIVMAVIFSRVMAFFILGTLSPLVHQTPATHTRPTPF